MSSKLADSQVRQAHVDMPLFGRPKPTADRHWPALSRPVSEKCIGVARELPARRLPKDALPLTAMLAWVAAICQPVGAPASGSRVCILILTALHFTN